MNEVHIILVHGTFARRAAWVRHGSPLRTFLQRNTQAHITFHPFEWSGRNSYFARVFASRKLAEFVTYIADTYENNHIFIIAHSHGGNIALYALRNPATAGQIAGLITLSTPFLTVRPREFNTLGTVGLSCALVVLFFAGLYCINMSCNVLIQRLSESALFCSGHESVYYPISLLYMFLVATISNKFGSGLRWLKSNLSLPNIHTDKLLVVRGPSDEASGYLGTIHFLETLIAFLSERQGAVDNFILRAGRDIKEKNDRICYNRFVRRCALRWAIIGGSLMVVTSVLSDFIREGVVAQHETLLLIVAMIAVFPVFVVIIYVAVGYIAGIGLAATVGVACLASLIVICVLFRPELGPFSGALVVSVEPCPPGLFQVLQIDGAGTRTFLWHSATYIHPAALSGIATWISQRIEQMHQPPPQA